MADEKTKSARFTFIGNPKNPADQREEATFRGITFKRGEAVTVEDEKIAEKLRGNTHFLEDGKKPADQRTEVARANQKPVDPRATVAPVYREADTPRAAQQQGAGESGFGYNKEAEQADIELAAEVRAKEKAAAENRKPTQASAKPAGK